MVPRQVQHELQVGELDAVFRSGRIEAAQLGKFLLEGLAHRSRPFLLFGCSPQLVDVIVLVHTQFFLDGTELVVQVIFPLLLVDFRLDFGIDFLLDPQQFHLVAQQGQQGHGPFLQIIILQQGDLFLVVFHLDSRRNEIDQEAEILNAAQGAEYLFRGESSRLDIIGRAVFEQVDQDLVLGILPIRFDIVQIVDRRPDIGIGLDDPVETEPLETLQESRHGPIRHLEGLQHLADGTEVEEIRFAAGILLGQVDLRDGPDELAATLLGFLDQPHRLLAADGDRVNGTREDDRVPQRKHRKRRRQIRLIDFQRALAGHHRDDVDLGRAGRKEGSEIVFLIFHVLLLSNHKSLGLPNCHKAGHFQSDIL